MRGWAIDPDTTSPIFLWVTVDGVGRHVQAAASRPDVGAAHPAYGDNHGFSVSIAASPGSHRVCVTAANVSIGKHTSLGCRSATVRSGPPFGRSLRGPLRPARYPLPPEPQFPTAIPAATQPCPRATTTTPRRAP